MDDMPTALRDIRRISSCFYPCFAIAFVVFHGATITLAIGIEAGSCFYPVSDFQLAATEFAALNGRKITLE